MATPGIAIPGTVVPSGSLTSPGGAPGIQGIQGPTAVSSDVGNIAVLGSDNLISVPSQTLWYARLRSLNAIGNPNFGVAQRNIGNLLTSPPNGSFIEDRWIGHKTTATLVYSAQRMVAAGALGGVPVPGTNFFISNNFLRITLTTQQATLAAGDCLQFFQYVEGPLLRELVGDVHSCSLLVRSSVAGLNFCVYLKDNPTTQSLVLLGSISTANVWTLVSFPNLPIWPGGTNFSLQPGAIGYQIGFCLASGSTFIAPAANIFQSGNFAAVSGISNFAASPVNSTFDIAFIQHEPGPLCTTPIDLPFTQNLDACLRYYQKSVPYGTAVGTTGSVGYAKGFSMVPVSGTAFSLYVNQPFAKPMAKTPAGICYNQSTGAVNSMFLYYAPSGTVPNGTTSLGVSGVVMTDKQIGSVNCVAGTSTAPMIGLFDWTADTDW